MKLTATEAASTPIDQNRTIKVQFTTSLNDHMQWEFKGPKQFQLNVHPGGMYHVDFYAKNISDHTITGQAVPSVSPGIAAGYLRKTECFCFDQQTLKPGESIDMPMVFHLDPALPSEIHMITISYTMFDTHKVENKSNVTTGKIAG